jgi:hypothetical protein
MEACEVEMKRFKERAVEAHAHAVEKCGDKAETWPR